MGSRSFTTVPDPGEAIEAAEPVFTLVVVTRGTATRSTVDVVEIGFVLLAMLGLFLLCWVAVLAALTSGAFLVVPNTATGLAIADGQVAAAGIAVTLVGLGGHRLCERAPGRASVSQRGPGT